MKVTDLDDIFQKQRFNDFSLSRLETLKNLCFLFETEELTHEIIALAQYLQIKQILIPLKIEDD